jgi:hypothetical protein
MNKTPEQMAEEFFESWQPEKPKYIRPKARQYALEKVTECFLAGYQAAQQWISVKESEPSDETWVLGTNGRDIECVFKHFTDCYSMTTITHWMPLPKQPKE